jgi:hypothetical protein
MSMTIGYVRDIAMPDQAFRFILRLVQPKLDNERLNFWLRNEHDETLRKPDRLLNVIFKMPSTRMHITRKIRVLKAYNSGLTRQRLPGVCGNVSGRKFSRTARDGA